MVKETGVSYYGCRYLDHAKRDFEEIINHSCNALLLAVSEFDCSFWYQGLKETARLAKEEYGLTTYWNFWGWGRVFGGEPVSLFLETHTNSRQVSAKSARSYSAACINSHQFQEYYFKWLEKVCNEIEIDGIFMDEPHYSFQATVEEWSCRCKICQKLFKEEHGHEMPKKLTKDVLSFRENRLLWFLDEAASIVKKADPKKKVIACLLPQTDALVGIRSWEKICEIENIDVLSTDPYWYAFKVEMEDFVPKYTLKALNLCKQFEKEAQIWVQLFRVPKGRENELAEGIHLINQLEVPGKKVNSIFGWPFKAGKGSVLSCDNPDLVWEIVGKAFRKVLEK